ncbi:MAG TPA: hypothetical protein VF765_02075 [Polyangiaceae bacterium]
MSFRLDLFLAELQKAEHGLFKSFNAKNSSMRHVVTLVEKGLRPVDVQVALDAVPDDKLKKYSRAIEYLRVHYPLPRPAITPIPAGSAIELTFDGSRGDLFYGLVEPRSYYAGRVQRMNPRAYASVYAADDYNNFIGVPRGAFSDAQLQRRQQQLHGQAPGGPRNPGFNLELFDAYYETLQGARFHPKNVRSLPQEKLAKEKGGDDFAARQTNKAIRRACKCGINMVATHPRFVNNGAKIHFLLDGMGELSNIAQKLGLRGRDWVAGGSVPITTSELCYCFRQWNLVQRSVWFYVNYQRVQPPWVQNWTLSDFNGREVKAGYQSWQHYAEDRIEKDQRKRGIG